MNKYTFWLKAFDPDGFGKITKYYLKDGHKALNVIHNGDYNNENEYWGIYFSSIKECIDHIIHDYDDLEISNFYYYELIDNRMVKIDIGRYLMLL